MDFLMISGGIELVHLNSSLLETKFDDDFQLFSPYWTCSPNI